MIKNKGETMNTRNSLVRARINEDLKHNVESILSQLGLTVSDAINVLFNQIALNKGLPFNVKIPNQLTRETLDKSARGIEVQSFDSVDALFDDLKE